MNFEEMQRKFGSTMSPAILNDQKKLFEKLNEIQDLIQVVFKYKGKYTVEENPAEWLSLAYFNKLNYTLVSLQNITILIDEFFSWLILKYLYEFYIKLKYISSTNKDSEFSDRLKSYLSSGERDNFKTKVEELKKLEESDQLLLMLIANHKEMYQRINSVAHPNVESLNIHKVSHTDEDRFRGLNLNIQFCLYFIYGVIEIMTNDSRFNLVSKPDLSKIKSLTGNV